MSWVDSYYRNQNNQSVPPRMIEIAGPVDWLKSIGRRQNNVFGGLTATAPIVEISSLPFRNEDEDAFCSMGLILIYKIGLWEEGRFKDEELPANIWLIESIEFSHKPI